MKALSGITGFMGLFFITIETLRRGIGYFATNATTMIEDYVCGALLMTAAYLAFRERSSGPVTMVVAWAYATGGLLVPFLAHLEAWMRGVTFRPDHPHDEIGIIVLKGIVWLICVVCLMVSARLLQNKVRARPV